MGQQNWEAEYNRWSKIINERFDEPKEEPKYKDPYIKWMSIKAQDRDAVKKIYEDIKNSQFDNPYWENKFKDLLDKAQQSGDATSTSAAMRGLRSDDAYMWNILIRIVKDDARPLFLMASKCQFVTGPIVEKAKCMIRMALGDVECSDYGPALYVDRSAVFARMDGKGLETIPKEDFDVACESRSKFTVTSKGQPSPFLTPEKGFEFVDMIRQECSWWGFGNDEQDATNLMEEYYKDVMCKDPSKQPPDPKSHKGYHQLAEQYRLNQAIEYNDGFYGTIEGKVELEIGQGRKPAAGAKVKVKAPKAPQEEWSATSDEDGHYEISNVLLHKDCSPFEISAEHQGDRTEKQFSGPLEKPDPSYTHNEDLVIETGWEGTLETKIAIVGEAPLFAPFSDAKDQGIELWKIEITFEKVRGNERIQIYKTKSATLDYQANWSAYIEGFTHKYNPDFRIDSKISKKSELVGRKLNSSECDLQLNIDKKKKTYTVEGVLNVQNIAGVSEEELKIEHDKLPALNERRREVEKTSNEVVHWMDDEIKGQFVEDEPILLEGSFKYKAAIENWPDVKKFLELFQVLAGVKEWDEIVTWRFNRKQTK